VHPAQSRENERRKSRVGTSSHVIVNEFTVFKEGCITLFEDPRLVTRRLPAPPPPFTVPPSQLQARRDDRRRRRLCAPHGSTCIVIDAADDWHVRNTGLAPSGAMSAVVRERRCVSTNAST
jgi:hypothetical protein